MIDRRALIVAALGGVVEWPLGAPAQQAKSRPRVIRMLENVPLEVNSANRQAFHRGLRELSHVEGQDYVTELRTAGGVAERLGPLAAELVRLQVDVIVTRGTPAVLAAKSATSTIPIVMAASGSPLEVGVVASLARPGANVTGLSAFTTELSAKRVEFAKSLLPQIKRIALVNNASNPVTAVQWEETRKAAQTLGLDAVLIDVRGAADIVPAFATALSQKIDALLFANDAANHSMRPMIVELAARHKVVALYGAREFVDAGGLMSYGVSYADLYYRAAKLVDKILKGASPADLPVEQPTKLELVINAKTAKALGLTIPPALLAFATEVIE
jgi:putative tryptophan/tyrosine transport system substrate-binding protein